MENKKATVGATMTWVVATIIILFVIMIFIYVAFAFKGEREVKNVLSSSEDVDFGESKAVDGVDAQQMLFALSKTKLNGVSIWDLNSKNDDEFKKGFKQMSDDLEIFLNKFPDYYSGDGRWILEVRPASSSLEDILFWWRVTGENDGVGLGAWGGFDASDRDVEIILKEKRFIHLYLTN